MAITVIVRATYTEEYALASFFTKVFGTGNSTIRVSYSLGELAEAP